MKPLLQEGDILRVTHRVSRVSPGDVAVFCRAGTMIVHRIVKVQKKGSVFLTKGDNVLFFDYPWVVEEEMIGIVTSLDRSGRAIDLQTWFWRLTGVVIARVSCLLGSYPRFFSRLLRHRRQSTKENR